MGGQLQVTEESPDFDGRAENFTKLYCIVDGPGDKIYEWYHNGSLINTQYFLPGFSSINSDTLTVYLQRADLRYEGSYQLFVSSAFGRIFCRWIKVQFRSKCIFNCQPRIQALYELRKCYNLIQFVYTAPLCARQIVY